MQHFPSNGISVDSNGFAGNGSWYVIGFNRAIPSGDIKWKANAAGTSATSYDLYIYLPGNTKNSHYVVSLDASGTWTNVGALGQTDPGNASSTVLIPNPEFDLLSPAVFGSSGVRPSGATGKGVYIAGADYDQNHYSAGTTGYSLWFDGTNYRTGTDGGSNGGSLIQAVSDGDTLYFYTVPSTPGNASQQTITPSNLGNYLRMSIDRGGFLNVLGPAARLGPRLTGYYSDAFTQSGGYRNWLLGTTYFDGTNFVTNSPGSNYVYAITGDSGIYPGGIHFYTAASTGNTQRVDSPSTFNNYLRMTIDNSGNVGIGTATPGQKLDVNGNINVSGNINAKYQDIAEWVPATKSIPAGSVVIVDPDRENSVVPSTQAYDTRVAGVVSPNPGLVLGEPSESKVKVATTGRVRVRVDASHAPIRVGDLLVTSSKEGVAMRSEPVEFGGVQLHRPGTLIGKALESLADGEGEVLVLLSSQ